jgi:hypothetical protein
MMETLCSYSPVVGPVLNFHMVGTAVGDMPILFNIHLYRLSYLLCVVYHVP